MKQTTHESENAPSVSDLLADLSHHLSDFVARCREARWFHPLFHVRIAEDHLADIHKARREEIERIARTAYTAEQADLQGDQDVAAAHAELEGALKDGLDDADIPRVVSAMHKLKVARRNICNSAEKDHNITELARA